MPLFPLQHSLNSDQLMTTASRAYFRSLLKTLPLSIIAVAAYHCMRFSGNYLPPAYQQYTLQVATLAGILLLPLLGGIFTIIDKTCQQIESSYGNIILLMGQRFLSLFGSLFSMILLPAVLIGLGIGGYIFLGMRHVPNIYIFGWIVLIKVAVFAALISKIFAPILVFTDQQDANAAIEQSERIVKGFYFRTFFHVLLVWLMLVFIILIPSFTNSYFPQILPKIPAYTLEGISEILLIMFAPWCFALLLTHKHDLQFRQNQKTTGVPSVKMKAPISENKKGKVTF